MPSDWLTGLAIAVGVGAASAGVASHIKNLADGVTPWENPQEWFTSELKAKGIGAGTAAATAGVGYGLDALAGSAIGGGVGGGATGATTAEAVPSVVADAIGSNVGTIPAESGAMTPTTVGGVVTPDKVNMLSALKEGTPNVLGRAARDVVTNTAMGAAKDYENPLRGAAMGAASGIATGVINQGANAAFRGMDNGFWSPSPKPEIDFKIQTPGPQDYSLLRSPQMGPQASMQMSTPQPQFGGRMLGAAAGMGGNMAGSAARMSVGSAMTPPPPSPPQNPYQSFGVTPYWMKQGYR